MPNWVAQQVITAVGRPNREFWWIHHFLDTSFASVFVQCKFLEGCMTELIDKANSRLTQCTPGVLLVIFLKNYQPQMLVEEVFLAPAVKSASCHPFDTHAFLPSIQNFLFSLRVNELYLDGAVLYLPWTRTSLFFSFALGPEFWIFSLKQVLFTLSFLGVGAISDPF